MSEFEFDQEIEMCNNRHFDEEDWKERVLSVTDDLALDLVFECFADRRINTLVDNGDLTIQEIADRFAKSVKGCLETEKTILASDGN